VFRSIRVDTESHTQSRFPDSKLPHELRPPSPLIYYSGLCARSAQIPK